jgi:hypothetical protein
MLAKLVKLETAFKEANNNMDTINIRDDIRSRREASSIHKGHQQQQQDLTTITLATIGRTAAETIAT